MEPTQEPQPVGRQNLAEFMREDHGGERWLVDQLFPEVGFSIWAAEPKTGKSTLVRQLSLAAAVGRPWLERSVTLGNTLYLVMDDDKRDVYGHYKQIMGDWGTHEDALERISFCWLKGQAWDICERTLQKHLTETQFSLVVLDTLVNLFPPGLDINSYTQMLDQLKIYTRLALACECHVIGLHHTTKGSMGEGFAAGMLGSQVIRGVTDGNIIIYRDRGDNRYINTELRRGREIANYQLLLNKETGVTRLGASQEDICRDVLIRFLLRGDATLSDLMQLGPRDLMRTIILDLEESGIIGREKGRYGVKDESIFGTMSDADDWDV